MPDTVKFPEIVVLPLTVKLSRIVVSEVVCPIVIGTPEVAVPIAIPPVVSDVSISISSLASISKAVSYTHLTLPTICSV